jgi:alanine racemase
MNRPSASTSRFEIDLGAIAHNIAVVKKEVGPGVRLFAALKADAYGFGLVPVAETAVGAGADVLAVGSIADGLTLRAAGLTTPILVYGGEPLTARAVAEIEHGGLIATIHDAASLRACVRSAPRALEVMVEVDVGLMRLGFDPDEAAEAVSAVHAAPALKLLGVYTHMRVEARRDMRSMRVQFRRFQRALGSAGPVPTRMAASSRVLDRSPGMTRTAVDVGRAIYGLLPRSGGRLGPRLRPAFAALRTQLTTVKTIAPGGRIGVIPFGRSSGMAELSPGSVLVRGRRAKVLGSPSLEHTRLDLRRHADAQVGDEVVIVGAQGHATIGIEEVLRAHPETPDSAVGLLVRAPVARVYLRESRGRAAARTAAPRTHRSRQGLR